MLILFDTVKINFIHTKTFRLICNKTVEFWYKKNFNEIVEILTKCSNFQIAEALTSMMIF